jgi:transposase
LNQVIEQLPTETQTCLQQELELLEKVQAQIHGMEERMKERISLTPDMQLLKTIPGVGNILAIVIDTEIGLVERFSSAEQLASYAGTVPAVKSSGGKVRYGHTPKESNHYLKWAFVEAANGPAQYSKKPHWQHRHVTRLYERVKRRKGHSVAIGAVARHLAEATFWILRKQEPYREPLRQKVLPKQA